MNLFRKIIDAHRRKVAERNATCRSLLNAIISFAAEMDNFLASSDDFLDLEQGEQILRIKSDFRTTLSLPIDKKLKKTADYKKLLSCQDGLIRKYDGFLQAISAHNNQVAQKKLAAAYKIVGAIEGHKLDSQQILCILNEAHNHLVIAGAGTGKTTTIIGKIKYMLSKNFCEPKDILVLSFTNVSAKEMKERINKESGHPIEASTFHKLGLNIIKACDGIVPKITKLNLRTLIKKQLAILMKDEEYLRSLFSYILYHGVAAKSEFEFTSKAEYDKYLEINPPTTLRNETVKSYGEMDIANFFSQNGITYQYEATYHIDTRTSEYGQYSPDFFLPEYKIYIEYFGINKNGEVPSFFSDKKGKSASENYQESMEWKRNLHAEQKTTLVECFAYENFSGDLLSNLEKNLKECGVTFTAKSPQAILEEMTSDGGKTLLDGFIELTETIVNLIKSNNYTFEQVRRLVSPDTYASESNFAILKLVEPIYNNYCKTLTEHGEIDFNDMINIATQYVSDGKFQHRYKYVIVDEYQDISKARFSLLKAMRDTNDYNLFCVGDDWQSIYRFAGSDIGFILNFENYWGVSEISRIETTYRFPQTLIDISGKFIMRNPKQVRKAIKGNAEDATFPLGEINGYTENNLADFLTTRLMDLPQNSTTFFIGRYNSDINYVRNCEQFDCRYDN